MRMHKLFLDDVRDPPSLCWDVVRSYDEFVKYIEDKGIPEVVSFDHDLGTEHYLSPFQSDTVEIPYDTFTEKTGYDCAKFLCTYCSEMGEDLPIYFVHSMNPVGAKNIHEYISSFLRMTRGTQP